MGKTGMFGAMIRRSSVLYADQLQELQKLVPAPIGEVDDEYDSESDSEEEGSDESSNEETLPTVPRPSQDHITLTNTLAAKQEMPRGTIDIAMDKTGVFGKLVKPHELTE